MDLQLYQGDLPDGLDLGDSIAVDTETMGLGLQRDRLCLVQLSAGDGNAHLVQLPPPPFEAPRLAAQLANPDVTKIFHFARFDLAMLQRHLGVNGAPLYCTRVASYLARTYTDRHGLKDLCRELLGKEISKQQQSSDWGAATLRQDQLEYAASDVLYLHELRAKLDAMLEREGRAELAQRCFEFLPARAALDLAGWAGIDVFAHL